MFKPNKICTDTYLSHNKIASMAMNSAIEEMSQLTGLTNNQCLSLFKQQLIRRNCQDRNSDIVNQKESEFIFGLFR